jgi:hypothetical protein
MFMSEVNAFGKCCRYILEEKNPIPNDYTHYPTKSIEKEGKCGKENMCRERIW